MALARQNDEGRSAPWLIPSEALVSVDVDAVEIVDEYELIDLREDQVKLSSELAARDEVEKDLRAKLRQATSDVEQERTARERAERAVSEAEAKFQVAEARAEER